MSVRFQSDSERTHITFADYDSDVLVVACAEYIGFMEMRHEETPLEWWFVGSLFVLAIPVLTVAYILWDAYCVTTR